MLNEWRENHEVTFPENHSHITRPSRLRIVSCHPNEGGQGRHHPTAQTEWHFIVLSNKLYQTFHDELKTSRISSMALIIIKISFGKK
jgi:hypothetical protein